MGLLGLVLAGIGVFIFQIDKNSQPTVEIISPTEPENKAVILVDIEGAVEKPGVYELTAAARVNDLLVKAGGLSALADRDWAVKNLNLAQTLVDGAKIFIPTQKEIQQFGGVALTSGAQVAGTSANMTGLININTASVSQLDSLWGIGEARAQAIISSRPYQKIEELTTKAKIPKNVFEAIKYKITLY